MLALSNGDKGGVGKSFLDRALIDFMIRYEIPVAPVDADVRNADVYSVVNKIVPVERLNLRTEDGWAALVDFMDKNASSKEIVVNLPAGIGEEEEKYAEIFADAANEIGVDVVVFWVMNHEAESVKLLKHSIENKLLNPANVVVVRNHYFGDNFDIWQGSQTRQTFLALGGKEVDLPVLSRKVCDQLLKADLLFSEALAGDKLGIYERLVLKKWLAEFDKMMASTGLYDVSQPAVAVA